MDSQPKTDDDIMCFDFNKQSIDIFEYVSNGKKYDIDG